MIRTDTHLYLRKPDLIVAVRAVDTRAAFGLGSQLPFLVLLSCQGRFLLTARPTQSLVWYMPSCVVPCPVVFWETLALTASLERVVVVSATRFTIDIVVRVVDPVVLIIPVARHVSEGWFVCYHTRVLKVQCYSYRAITVKPTASRIHSDICPRFLAVCWI